MESLHQEEEEEEDVVARDVVQHLGVVEGGVGSSSSFFLVPSFFFFLQSLCFVMFGVNSIKVSVVEWLEINWQFQEFGKGCKNLYVLIARS